MGAAAQEANRPIGVTQYLAVKRRLAVSSGVVLCGRGDVVQRGSTLLRAQHSLI